MCLKPMADVVWSNYRTWPDIPESNSMVGIFLFKLGDLDNSITNNIGIWFIDVSLF